MIIGGAVVYQDFLPYYDLLYRTVIEENFSGDTYFPSINWNEWELRSWKQGVTDEKNKYAHRFETYRRKNKNSTSK